MLFSLAFLGLGLMRRNARPGQEPAGIPGPGDQLDVSFLVLSGVFLLMSLVFAAFFVWLAVQRRFFCTPEFPVFSSQGPFATRKQKASRRKTHENIRKTQKGAATQPGGGTSANGSAAFWAKGAAPAFRAQRTACCFFHQGPFEGADVVGIPAEAIHGRLVRQLGLHSSYSPRLS